MAKSVGATQTVEVSVTIVASPETVFRFFADPAWFARWMGTGAVIEPRAGGAVILRYPQGPPASGRLLEIDPPRRVVFTWGIESDDQSVPPGSTTVEVTLMPVAEGTQVTLRHHDLPDAQMIWGATQGWRFWLALLAAQAAAAQFGEALDAIVDAWVEAWAEPDPAARRSLLERCFAVDGTFRDPFAVVDGRAELDERIATMHAFGAPGRLERSGPVQQCHTSIRFPWHIKNADGATISSGTNFGELALSGQIRSLVGFWDLPAP